MRGEVSMFTNNIKLFRMEQLSRTAEGAYKTEKLTLPPGVAYVILFASSQKDRTGKHSENSQRHRYGVSSNKE